MGLLFSRFKRKQTAYEILEDIDKEINRLQRNKKVNQNRQKQFVNSLLFYSIAVYIISAVIFFCLYFPETWKLRLIYSLPLLIFPIVVWGLKKSLHWYFLHRIKSTDTELQDLRDRKNQILEDVIETETYKKAREILTKHDPEKLRKLEGIPEKVLGTPGTLVQQRSFNPTYAAPIKAPGQVQVAPRPGPSHITQEKNGVSYSSQPSISNQRVSVQPQPAMFPSQAAISGAPPFRLPMARSVLPRERGTMDRLMDYLVGDGPENRYALICWQCFSHNGMALREEFEYLSFRCCYCYTVNPARKQRPTAPRLEFFAPPGMTGSTASDSSGSSEGSTPCDDNQIKDLTGDVDTNTEISTLYCDISLNNKTLQPLAVSTPNNTELHSATKTGVTTTATERSEIHVETNKEISTIEPTNFEYPDSTQQQQNLCEGIEQPLCEPDVNKQYTLELCFGKPIADNVDGQSHKSHICGQELQDSIIVTQELYENNNERQEQQQQNIDGQELHKSNNSQELHESEIDSQGLRGSYVEEQPIAHSDDKLYDHKFYGQEHHEFNIDGQEVHDSYVGGQQQHELNIRKQQLPEPIKFGIEPHETHINQQEPHEAIIEGRNIIVPNYEVQELYQPIIEGQQPYEPNTEGQQSHKPNTEGQQPHELNIEEHQPHESEGQPDKLSFDEQQTQETNYEQLPCDLSNDGLELSEPYVDRQEMNGSNVDGQHPNVDESWTFVL